MLESHLTRVVEPHVDDRPLRGSQHHLVDERLAFVATAVTTDQLHPSTGQREVEDPRVRRVHEIEAYDLSHRRLARELTLAVDQHHVPEPPHRGVVGPRTVEWRDLAILD